MWKAITSLTVFIAISCTPVTVDPAPTSSATAPAATPSASAQQDTTFTMPTDRDMYEFFGDQGSLIAYSSQSTPPPYESKIQRADPATKTWRTIYQTDAMFQQLHVAAGRMAILEYREPVQGRGASSEKIVVLDLTSGRATTIDEFALSPATYHGGGGGPRGPSFAVALGADRIAWTRLVEGAGGSVTGELELAPLSDPARRQTIGSSIEWIGPLAVDNARLVYAIGGKTQDELHVRDLATGGDTVIARAQVGNTALVGSPQMDRASVTGTWAIWAENTPSGTASIHALDLKTGTERTFDAGGTYCPVMSAGGRYVAWSCTSNGGPTQRVYDAATVQPVLAPPPGLGLSPTATEDGLIWFTLVADGRTVTLYRPR